MDVGKLTSYEQERVLRVVLHHMDQDQRRKLMLACPTEYVKMAPHTGETVLGRLTAEFGLA